MPASHPSNLCQRKRCKLQGGLRSSDRQPCFEPTLPTGLTEMKETTRRKNASSIVDLRVANEEGVKRSLLFVVGAHQRTGSAPPKEWTDRQQPGGRYRRDFALHFLCGYSGFGLLLCVRPNTGSLCGCAGLLALVALFGLFAKGQIRATGFAPPPHLSALHGFFGFRQRMTRLMHPPLWLGMAKKPYPKPRPAPFSAL